MVFLPERSQKLKLDEYAQSTFTEFTFKLLYDEVETKSSELEDTRSETLRSTESWYELSLGWHNSQLDAGIDGGKVSYYLRDSSGLSLRACF
jgi:hypothetical protein